jgi:hypothetical protein
MEQQAVYTTTVTIKAKPYFCRCREIGVVTNESGQRVLRIEAADLEIKMIGNGGITCHRCGAELTWQYRRQPRNVPPFVERMETRRGGIDACLGALEDEIKEER